MEEKFRRKRRGKQRRQAAEKGQGDGKKGTALPEKYTGRAV